jgi:hypothetical protein
MPVTIPVITPTEASALAGCQVPPLSESNTTTEDPIHIFNPPDPEETGTAGRGFTVAILVTKQPDGNE